MNIIWDPLVFYDRTCTISQQMLLILSEYMMDWVFMKMMVEMCLSLVLSFKSALFLQRRWLITNIVKHTQSTNNSGIRFISRFTMNGNAPKLQKCWTHKIAFEIILKMLKQPNFFYSRPSTHPKEALAKFFTVLLLLV